MNDDEVKIILRHAQEVAIQFISYRGPLHNVATFVAHAIGEFSPPVETIAHILAKEETCKELLSWDVGIWRNTIGDWSLVSLATPTNIDTMRNLLSRFPISNTQCRWCLQDTKRLAYLELVPELDIHGLPVDRSLLHKICLKPWLTMRNQVWRANAKPAKASLL